VGPRFQQRGPFLLVEEFGTSNIEHRTLNVFPLNPEAPHPGPLLVWRGEGDRTSAAVSQTSRGGFECAAAGPAVLDTAAVRARGMQSRLPVFDPI